MERKKPQRKKQDVIIEIDVKALIMLAVTVFLCVLFLLCCFFYVRGFLGIKKFEIVGISTYDDIDIINASRLKRGDKLYRMSFDEVEERILEECPYLSDVEITTRFPSTVRFSVEESSPQWYIELSGDYYALDADLKVLHESTSKQYLERVHATRLLLPGVMGVMKGEVPEFGIEESGERDETEIRKTLEIISMVRRTTFKTRITSLDVRQRSDITLIVDGKYLVRMGNMENFEAKLEKVKAILDSDKIKDHPYGEINAAGNPTSFKPLDALPNQ